MSNELQKQEKKGHWEYTGGKPVFIPLDQWLKISGLDIDSFLEPEEKTEDVEFEVIPPKQLTNE